MQILEQSRVYHDKQHQVISPELLIQLNVRINDDEPEIQVYLLIKYYQGKKNKQVVNLLTACERILEIVSFNA
jgi:hypothetical protein